MSAQLIIDEHAYVIRSDEQLASLADLILDAVRHGGAFVPIPVGETTTDVLIAQETRVRIEHAGEDDTGAEALVGDADFDHDQWRTPPQT